MDIWHDIRTAPKDGRVIMIFIKPLALAVPAMWTKAWRANEKEQWRECWQFLAKDMWIGCKPGVLGLPPDADLLPSMWAEPPANIAHIKARGANFRSAH